MIGGVFRSRQENWQGNDRQGNDKTIFLDTVAARPEVGVKSKLFQAALAKDVFHVPGLLCYADNSTRRKPDKEMRISFGGASEENIREGIKRLGAVLRKVFR